MQNSASRDVALLIGRTGRWRWPWALLGPVVIIALTMAIYMFLLGPIERWVAGRYETPLGEDVHLAPGRLDSYFGFVGFAFSLVVPTVIVLAVVHGEGWHAALGPLRRFDWSLFGKAALANLIVALLGSGIDFARYPGSMQLMQHGWWHVTWLLLGALVILPQAFAEDYVFKGYLLRVWGAVVPYRLVVVPLAAAAFTGLHAGNADVGSDLRFNLVGFLLLELLAFTLVLRTGSVATATGLHWANNVFVMSIIATMPGQSGNLALIEFAHPLLMAGGSKASDPVEIASLVGGVALLWALLSWPRSPLYLPSAHYPDPPAADPTVAPGQTSPEEEQTGAGSSAAASH